MNETTNRQIRIFISSTFQDMHNERDYLITKVFPRLRVEAAKRDVTVVPLDLRWGITEEESKNGKVLEICLEEIDNSHPFFIGLLGNRYGSHPEMSDLINNPRLAERYPWVKEDIKRELSITEIEMQYGALRSRKRINAYFYLKEKDGLELENSDKLENLRNSVLKNGRYPVDSYVSPEDLGSKVERDFMILLNNLYQEKQLSEQERERIAQESFLHSLTTVYIPNDDNFKILDCFLANNNMREFVINGETGLGKSALIANWIKAHENEESYNIIYYFVGNGGLEGDYRRIQRYLIGEICDKYRLSDKLSGQEENHYSDIKENLSELFEEIQSRKPLLIAIDGVDQLASFDTADSLNWLPLPTTNIKYLFSTQNTYSTMDTFRNRDSEIFTLQPLDESDRYRLVEKYLGTFRKSLNKEQIERIIKDPQSQNTFVLQTLLNELLAFGIYEQLDQQINCYLEAANTTEFFHQVLERNERDYGEELVRHSLALIAISRNGLSEHEIMGLVKVRQLEWSQFYCSFHHHLMVKDGLIVFRHQFLRRAVESRYFDGGTKMGLKKSLRIEYSNNKYLYRGEICDYFKDMQTSRAWEELSYQYYELDDFDHQYRLLLNLQVFQYLSQRNIDTLGLYWKKLYARDQQRYDFSEFFNLPISEGMKKEVIYRNLGLFCLQYLQKYELALKFYQESLRLETNSKLIANIYNDMGVVYHDMYNYPQSLECLEKAVCLRKKIYGDEHLSTAHVYCNMGVLLVDMKKYEQAHEYLTKSLELRKKLLGETHADTGFCYMELANLYFQMENMKEAEEYYSKALKIFRLLPKKNYHHIQRCNDDLEKIFEKKAKGTDSLKLHQEMLSKYLDLYGEKNEKVAESLANIGKDYENIYDFEHALQSYLEALRIAESLWGGDIRTTSYYIKVGDVYCYMDYKLAIKYYDKSLRIREEVLGYENKLTEDIYLKINRIFDDKEITDYYLLRIAASNSEIEKARLYLRLAECCPNSSLQRWEYKLTAYALFEKRLGKEHEITTNLFDHEIKPYITSNDRKSHRHYYLKEDIYILEGIVAISQRIMGKEHPISLIGLRSLADNYVELQEYDKASESYKKLLGNISSQSLQEELNRSYLYDSMGQICFKQGHFNEAIAWYHKAIEVYVENEKEKEYSIGETYMHMADAYRKLNDNEQAEQAYMTALSTWNEVQKEKKATCLKQMGEMYEEKGDYDAAVRRYVRSLTIYHNHSPFEDYNRIAYLYVKLSNYEEALNYLFRAYECRVEFENSWFEYNQKKAVNYKQFCRDSLWRATIKSNIAYVYQCQFHLYKALRTLRLVLQYDLPSDRLDKISSVENQIKDTEEYLKKDSFLEPLFVDIRKHVIEKVNEKEWLSLMEADAKDLTEHFVLMTTLFDDICQKYNLEGKREEVTPIMDFVPFMSNTIIYEYMKAADSMLFQIQDCHPLIGKEFLKFQKTDDEKLMAITEKIEDKLIRDFLDCFIGMDIFVEGLFFDHLSIVKKMEDYDYKVVADYLNSFVRRINKKTSIWRGLEFSLKKLPLFSENDICHYGEE